MNEDQSQSVRDMRAKMKLNRPITGVIQKDRIWEQWYDPEIFNLDFPEMSQKDYLFQCIGDEPDRVILNNRGKKTFTVAQFKSMVEEFERAFAAAGIQKGDVIATVALNTPELYAIKYAATSLGGITCHLNVFDVGITDDGKNRLVRQLELVEPKLLFVLDYLEDKVSAILNAPEFNSIVKIILPLDRSTPWYEPERVALTLKSLGNRLKHQTLQGRVSLSAFLRGGKSVKEEDVHEVYEPGLPCNIAFTSGTTGINKAVLISHDANNILSFQQIVGKIGFYRGQKALSTLPPFIAFWDADLSGCVLAFGGESVIELPSVEKLPDCIAKYKPQVVLHTQHAFNTLLAFTNEKAREMCSSIEQAVVSGSRCDINAASALKRKTGIDLVCGYGASEMDSTFCYTHPNCYKLGSSGIPLPFNNVKIVGEDFQDLTYNQRGQLLITGPCMMNGYYKRPDLTEKALYTDVNGTVWYKTGDYAVMDDDGVLTVLDRYMPPEEISVDGKIETVQLLDLVEIVLGDPHVKIAKMTAHDGKMVLHLALNQTEEAEKQFAIDSVLNTIRARLPEKYWPDFISVMDELPRTQVGKVDYKQLQALGKTICSRNAVRKKLHILNQSWNSV